jgi:hypothetical protein
MTAPNDIPPYPPFSGLDAVCPKCTCPFQNMYFPAGTVPVLPYGDRAPDGEILYAEKVGDGPEWLLRTCVACKYRRAESCADATEKGDR